MKTGLSSPPAYSHYMKMQTCKISRGNLVVPHLMGGYAAIPGVFKMLSYESELSKVELSGPTSCVKRGT